MERTILHVDMNNCFASIEIKLHPEWRGVPLAVCGSMENRHGIVLAKSQEAKAYGVATGESICEAKGKCPDLLIVPPHYEAYLDHSRQARAIYYEYTNLVEPFGLDECWLDVTGSTRLFGTGPEIAETLRRRVRRELGITVSIGVSFNKIFAKLGSDMKKPDAITPISYEHFRELVWPLGVRAMIGIGPATERKLQRYQIRTLGDLAKARPDFLRSLLGINGVRLWEYANGHDYAPVQDADYRAPIQSIGRGTTCREDLENDEEVRCVLQELSLDVSRRLMEHHLEATGVQITVRDSELLNHQYQCPLPFIATGSIALTETAFALFRQRYPWHLPVRALTIRAISLISRRRLVQGQLFDTFRDFEKKENADVSIQAIRRKFGKNGITFASLLGDIKLPTDRTEVVTLPNSRM